VEWKLEGQGRLTTQSWSALQAILPEGLHLWPRWWCNGSHQLLLSIAWASEVSAEKASKVAKMSVRKAFMACRLALPRFVGAVGPKIEWRCHNVCGGSGGATFGGPPSSKSQEDCLLILGVLIHELHHLPWETATYIPPSQRSKSMLAASSDPNPAFA
jgi:hypothetical protein